MTNESERVKVVINGEEVTDSGVYSSYNESWGWGFTLIIAGTLFLLDNLGYDFVRFYNWWAIFILAPGINMLVRAFGSYQRHGRLTNRGRNSAFVGAVMVFISFSFLFEFDLWSFAAPIMLIVAGLWLLFTNR